MTNKGSIELTARRVHKLCSALGRGRCSRKPRRSKSGGGAELHPVKNSANLVTLGRSSPPHGPTQQPATRRSLPPLITHFEAIYRRRAKDSNRKITANTNMLIRSPGRLTAVVFKLSFRSVKRQVTPESVFRTAQARPYAESGGDGLPCSC